MADYLDGKTYPSVPIYLALASYPGFALTAILVTSPFSFLIMPILLFYLVYPNRLHSRKAMVAVVCTVIILMIANYGVQIAFSGGYSS